MKTKLIKMVIAFTACGMLAGCGATTDVATTDGGEATEAADGEIGEYNFVLAEVNPADTIVGQIDQAFADKVAELSNGAMTVDVYFEAEKGKEFDVVTEMIDGTSDVDIARISAYQFNNFGCETPTLISIPFTFENEEHFWKFADSDIAQGILNEPSEYGLGVRGLFIGEEGFRHFFGNKKLTSIDDFKGLRIRVSSDQVMTGMVEGLGASPYQIQLEDIPAAFQNDEVDAAEQPIVNYAANNFNEDAPYVILDGHTLGVIEFIISEEVWNSLSPAQQNVITEASKYAQDRNKELVATEEAKTIEDLKSKGVEIVEVADKTPFRDATKAVTEANIAGKEDLYQQILDCAK